MSEFTRNEVSDMIAALALRILSSESESDTEFLGVTSTLFLLAAAIEAGKDQAMRSYLLPFGVGLIRDTIKELDENAH